MPDRMMRVLWLSSCIVAAVASAESCEIGRPRAGNGTQDHTALLQARAVRPNQLDVSSEDGHPHPLELHGASSPNLSHSRELMQGLGGLKSWSFSKA